MNTTSISTTNKLDADEFIHGYRDAEEHLPPLEDNEDYLRGYGTAIARMEMISNWESMGFKGWMT